jgi:outer membrane protein OmpA-like peptidoglycan-associated protein
MRPALAPSLILLATGLAGCATVTPTSPRPAGDGDGELVREAELARVRCLLVAPLENVSDAPAASGAATGALLDGLDPARTRALPVAELRALLADTPVELPEGVSPAAALELAELLGADAALYGTVEGRSRDREPELRVTLRLALAGSRSLLFATTVRVTPAPGEPLAAAVRRTVLDRARPMVERLGAAGRFGCFTKDRQDALRAAALAQRASPLAAPAPPAPAPATAAPRPAARAALHTPRQRDLARALLAGGRATLDDVAFTGRTAELARDAGLADLAVVLAAEPTLTVRLEGFVDATGDPAADGKLSRDMAAAAVKRLADLGVDAGRLGAAGLGGEHPILPNFTARGRAANRRVEVVSPR